MLLLSCWAVPTFSQVHSWQDDLPPTIQRQALHDLWLLNCHLSKLRSKLWLQHSSIPALDALLVRGPAACTAAHQGHQQGTTGPAGPRPKAGATCKIAELQTPLRPSAGGLVHFRQLDTGPCRNKELEQQLSRATNKSEELQTQVAALREHLQASEEAGAAQLASAHVEAQKRLEAAIREAVEGERAEAAAAAEPELQGLHQRVEELEGLLQVGPKTSSICSSSEGMQRPWNLLEVAPWDLCPLAAAVRQGVQELHWTC